MAAVVGFVGIVALLAAIGAVLVKRAATRREVLREKESRRRERVRAWTYARPGATRGGPRVRQAGDPAAWR